MRSKQECQDQIKSYECKRNGQDLPEEELEEELDEPEVAEFIIIGLSLTMDADASQYESQPSVAFLTSSGKTISALKSEALLIGVTLTSSIPRSEFSCPLLSGMISNLLLGSSGIFTVS